MDTHYLPIGQLLPNSISNIVTCTPTESIVLNSLERLTMDCLFTSVVDFFNTHMTEISKSLCLEFAKNGRIVCDTEGAAHEAGDLLLAGLQPLDYLKFKEIVNRPESERDRRTSCLNPADQHFGTWTQPELRLIDWVMG